jgi:hypothetical protein
MTVLGNSQKKKKKEEDRVQGLKFNTQNASRELESSCNDLKSNYRADMPEDLAHNIIVQVAELLHFINVQHLQGPCDNVKTLLVKLGL